MLLTDPTSFARALVASTIESPIESVAVVFGIANVYLVARENIWCWPAGIVNVALYIYVFSGAKLYADSGLQVIYLGMSIYGWYAWSRRKSAIGSETKEPELRVTHASRRELLGLGILGAAGTGLLGVLFRRYTDASFPFADSALAAYSLVAQWLMTKKRLENWILWCILDVGYIAMYRVKSMGPTMFLYAVFFLLSANGLRQWRALLRKQGDAALAASTPQSEGEDRAAA